MNGKKNILIISFVFLIFIILNFSITLNGSGDDSILFLGPLTSKFGGNYIDFLLNRYQNWSSRLIIEIFTLLSVQHHFFWRIINSFALTILAIVPVYLFDIKKNRISSIVVSTSLLLCIPKSMFNETGWIATTTNYLWPLASFISFVYIVLHYNSINKYRRFYYMLSILLLMLSSNLEQLCIVSLFTIAIIIINSFRYEKQILRLIPYVIISISNLLLILLSPGNKIRYGMEVKRWFPDYETLTFFRKVELGFSSTFKNLYLDNYIVFILFSLLIAVTGYKIFKSFQLVFSSLPFIAVLIFGFFKDVFGKQIPVVDFIINSFTNYGTIFQLNSPRTWVADIFLIIITLCIIISMFYLLHDDSNRFVKIIFILCLGSITKMMMAFSPTVWASGSRTSIFLLYCINLVSLLIIDKFDLKSKYTFIPLGILGMLNFLV